MGKKSREHRRAGQRDLRVQEFWHGGAAGRMPGDSLLSAEEMIRLHGRSSTFHELREQVPYAAVTRRDRVYFSTDRELARSFARYTEERSIIDGGVTYGTLYRVAPHGEIQEDPDFAGRGVSWCAAEAKVLEVVEIDVQMSLEDAVRAAGRFSTWSDGRPMYFDDGRFTITPELESQGFVQGEIDPIVPPWTPWEEAFETIRSYITETYGRPVRY